MAIKVLCKHELLQNKVNQDELKLKIFEEELVDQIKKALACLINLDDMHDIKDYIDELIINWKEEEIEYEE